MIQTCKTTSQTATQAYGRAGGLLQGPNTNTFAGNGFMELTFRASHYLSVYLSIYPPTYVRIYEAVPIYLFTYWHKDICMYSIVRKPAPGLVIKAW